MTLAQPKNEIAEIMLEEPTMEGMYSLPFGLSIPKNEFTRLPVIIEIASVPASDHGAAAMGGRYNWNTGAFEINYTSFCSWVSASAFKASVVPATVKLVISRNAFVLEAPSVESDEQLLKRLARRRKSIINKYLQDEKNRNKPEIKKLREGSKTAAARKKFLELKAIFEPDTTE